MMNLTHTLRKQLPALALAAGLFQAGQSEGLSFHVDQVALVESGGSNTFSCRMVGASGAVKVYSLPVLSTENFTLPDPATSPLDWGITNQPFATIPAWTNTVFRTVVWDSPTNDWATVGRFFVFQDQYGNNASNIIGYWVKRLGTTTNQSAFEIIANPFVNSPTNNLNHTLRLTEAAAPYGFTLYRWDVAAQAYGAPIQWSTNGGGLARWQSTNTNPSWLQVPPGEGFYMQNPSPYSADVFMYGIMPLNTRSNFIPTNSVLKSSIVMNTDRLANLDYPSRDGDTIYMFDVQSQDFVGWTYIDGYGWYTVEGVLDVLGPVIKPGTGFWLLRMYVEEWWNQTRPVSWPSQY